MKKHMRANLPALLAAAMLMLCASCGLLASQDDVPPAMPQLTETPIPEPTLGGALFVPIPVNPSSINPLKANTKEVVNVLSLVFENVVGFDQNNRIVPGLAENWDVDETGRVWRLMIRKGVKWQGSNEELTADDIVFTFETLKNLGAGNSIYARQLDVIETVYASDTPNTLIVEGKEPGFSALYAMIFPVVSRKFDGAELPVGTGPYRIKGYEPSTGMELTANEGWWRQPPYIRTVMARAQADQESALAGLALKQINFMPSMSITAGRYRVIGEIDSLDIMTQYCEFLVPNMSNNILADLRVRQAIAYALDRREFISKVYLNHAVTSDVPVPPDSWLYSTDFQVYDTNIARARELLDEADWKDRDGDGIRDKQHGAQLTPLQFTLVVNQTPEAPERQEAAKFIRDQLLKVGVKIEIIPRRWLDDVNEYQTSLEGGSFDLALIGLNLDVNGDLSDLIGTGGAHNYGKYRSGGMDALIERTQRAVSQKEVAEAFTALQRKIVDELPVITLYFHTEVVLYDANIIGIKDIRDQTMFRTIEKWYFNN